MLCHRISSTLGPDQNTCVCGLVLGVPTKTRAPVVWRWGPQPKHVRLWFGVGGPNQNTSRILNREVYLFLSFTIIIYVTCFIISFTRHRGGRCVEDSVRRLGYVVLGPRGIRSIHLTHTAYRQAQHTPKSLSVGLGVYLR